MQCGENVAINQKNICRICQARVGDAEPPAKRTKVERVDALLAQAKDAVEAQLAPLRLAERNAAMALERAHGEVERLEAAHARALLTLREAEERFQM
jgi:hypothetical protein